MDPSDGTQVFRINAKCCYLISPAWFWIRPDHIAQAGLELIILMLDLPTDVGVTRKHYHSRMEQKGLVQFEGARDQNQITLVP